jgi:hypothetical protein
MDPFGSNTHEHRFLIKSSCYCPSTVCYKSSVNLTRAYSFVTLATGSIRLIHGTNERIHTILHSFTCGLSSLPLLPDLVESCKIRLGLIRLASLMHPRTWCKLLSDVNRRCTYFQYLSFDSAFSLASLRIAGQYITRDNKLKGHTFHVVRVPLEF